MTGKRRDWIASPFQHCPLSLPAQITFCMPAIHIQTLLSLAQTLAPATSLSTAALRMQNSMPKARDIKTQQHAEISQEEKSCQWGREVLTALEEREGLVTPDFEHVLANQRGPHFLRAQLATPQLPGTAGPLTPFGPRGWDPRGSWPGGEGCTGSPRRSRLLLLLFPQAHKRSSSPPHGHPCRDGSGTRHQEPSPRHG